MGDVVHLDDYRAADLPNTSNGAREALVDALIAVPNMTWLAGSIPLADFLLLSLWSDGFVVVPIEPGNDAA